MRLPNFNNLEMFVKKATIGVSPSISITRTEAQHAANEYQKLIKYTLELQDRLVVLEREIANPTEIEIVTGNFQVLPLPYATMNLFKHKERKT